MFLLHMRKEQQQGREQREQQQRATAAAAPCFFISHTEGAAAGAGAAGAAAASHRYRGLPIFLLHMRKEQQLGRGQLGPQQRRATATAASLFFFISRKGK